MEWNTKINPAHVSAVYAHLLTRARGGEQVTYGELAPLVGIAKWGNHAQWYIGWVLGYIAEAEVREGRPMLSAIVVNKSGSPGVGLWNLATELALYHGPIPESGGSIPAEAHAFWVAQRQGVFDQWKPQ